MIMWKSRVARALCSAPVASLVRLTHPKVTRVRALRFDTSSPVITPRIQAMMFWGFYESAELRMIQRYVNGQHTAVELGGSIGITGGHIVSRLRRGGHYVGVEALGSLMPAYQSNLNEHAASNAVDVQLIHAAVDYSGDAFASLTVSKDSTGARVSRVGDARAPTTTLQEVLEMHAVADGFVLVADIEGTEMALVRQDAGSLRRCGLAILEVHAGEHAGAGFQPSDVTAALRQQGFELVDRDGNVLVVVPRQS
jgi:FkbM family methyltransferase